MIKEKGIYYAHDSFYDIIKECGGNPGNPGHRPIVCLIKSIEHDEMYWAIPLGNLKHRDEEAVNRIKRYMSLPDKDIRSCFYHTGRTTNRSIFFISDSFPISSKHIKEEHLDSNKNHYVIKNNVLISELTRKLFRVISYDNANPNYFRQNLTNVKNYIINELDEKVNSKSFEVENPSEETVLSVSEV